MILENNQYYSLVVFSDELRQCSAIQEQISQGSASNQTFPILVWFVTNKSIQFLA